MKSLTLSIGNLEQLQQGVTTRHQFDRRGGTIGSQGADWLIADRAQGVRPIHCEIRWIEGSFCAIDCSNQTFLNGSLLSLGQQPPVRLREGDQLRIGAFRLQVHYPQSPATSASLEVLLRPEHRKLDAWLGDTAIITARGEDKALQPPRVDICDTFRLEIGRDPLAALEATHSTKPSRQNSVQRLITGEPS
ncbi:MULTISPECIES: FHA domain-containing protein [unclassified Pseudomonas]|uniref:FHA domain-containing protein n=1 Tax=unclassified Pseudomonas TaxID=196821 RepID=UPI003806B245